MRIDGDGTNNPQQPRSSRSGQEDLSAWRETREAVRQTAQKAAQQKESQKDRGDRAHGLSREDLEKTMEELNGVLEITSKDLRFELHQPTNRLMVHIINRESKEVLSTMPPQEMLDLAARIRNMIGLIIDQEV